MCKLFILIVNFYKCYNFYLSWICYFCTVGKELKAVEGQFIPEITGRIPRRDVAIFMLECAIRLDWNQKFVAVGLET